MVALICTRRVIARTGSPPLSNETPASLGASRNIALSPTSPTNRLAVSKSPADFGVPQLGHRVVFIGIRDGLRVQGDLAGMCEGLLRSRKRRKPFIVHDAISDL